MTARATRLRTCADAGPSSPPRGPRESRRQWHWPGLGRGSERRLSPAGRRRPAWVVAATRRLERARWSRTSRERSRLPGGKASPARAVDWHRARTDWAGTGPRRPSWPHWESATAPSGTQAGTSPRLLRAVAPSSRSVPASSSPVPRSQGGLYVPRTSCWSGRCGRDHRRLVRSHRGADRHRGHQPV